jgi:molecular chaperone GrpE
MGKTEEKNVPSEDIQSECEETGVLEGEIVEPEAQQEEQQAEEPLQETGLKEALEEAEQQAAKYLDGWQRAQAAFANYRKRMEAEKQAWRMNAVADFAMRILPVLDDFERAFLSVPEALKDSAWTQGIALILRKLSKALESEDIRSFEVEVGQPFDPMYHQAVSHQEVEGLEEGQIVAGVQKGYRLGDRVLRPALVVVAKASGDRTSATDSETVDQEDKEGVLEPEAVETDGED